MSERKLKFDTLQVHAGQKARSDNRFKGSADLPDNIVCIQKF